MKLENIVLPEPGIISFTNRLYRTAILKPDPGNFYQHKVVKIDLDYQGWSRILINWVLLLKSF